MRRCYIYILGTKSELSRVEVKVVPYRTKLFQLKQTCALTLQTSQHEDKMDKTLFFLPPTHTRTSLSANKGTFTIFLMQLSTNISHL